jgi:hypothetical protein
LSGAQLRCLPRKPGASRATESSRRPRLHGSDDIPRALPARLRALLPKRRACRQATRRMTDTPPVMHLATPTVRTRSHFFRQPFLCASASSACRGWNHKERNQIGLGGEASGSAARAKAVGGVTLTHTRRGRDSNPSSSVGNNLERHATLHTNARKIGSKCFGSLSPLVPVSRRESSGVGLGLGSGWAALHGIRRVRVEAPNRTWLRTSKSGPNGLR